MRGKSEGLYLFTRHSSDCKFHSLKVDRDETRRCNCVRYIRGTAPDGKRIRQSTGTPSWEKARRVLDRTITEHDPVNRPLFQSSGASFKEGNQQPKTIKEDIDQFVETKRAENIVDMSHYEGFFQRELCCGATSEVFTG